MLAVMLPVATQVTFAGATVVFVPATSYTIVVMFPHEVHDVVEEDVHTRHYALQRSQLWLLRLGQ